MYTAKNIGESIEPCGTPYGSGTGDEYTPDETLCDLPITKKLNYVYEVLNKKMAPGEEQ